MSKRIIASCLVIGALIGSNAMASQARQVVLGTQDPLNVLSAGTHGSVLVDDNMNVFYNPSYANDFSNWASIEKATGYPGAASQAEGGFINNFGPVLAGLYLNRADAVNTNLVNNTTTGGATPNYVNDPVRPFDLIVAGDMGVKWGLMLSHGSRKIGPTTGETRELGSKEMNLRAGVQVMGFEPFAAITLSGSEKQAGTAATDINEDKYKSFSFGTRYKFGEWVPFAVVRMDTRTDGPVAAGGTSTEGKGRAYGLGFARNTKVAEGTSLNYGASYWSLTNPANTTASSLRNTRKALPIDVSLEHDATSWLALRAGLAYRLMDQTNGLTNAATTTGRIGAGLKFGKAMVDFAVGSASGATSSVDGSNFDFANGLFSVASMTYSW